MKKTVMLVVDFASMREFLGAMLKGAGYDVVDAGDGTEALAQLAKNKVDLVVSNLNMPNMDGIMLRDEMLRLPEHRFTPILMMASANDALPMPMSIPKREGDGGLAWIVKPFRFEQFFGMVSRLIFA